MLYRLLMTFSATAMMPAVYMIKSGCSFALNNRIITGVVILLIPLCLPLLCSFLIHHKEEEDLSENIEFELVDSNFLPVYLGYFFVALSVNDDITLYFVYAILYIFSFVSNVAIFNPVLLLFKYHFYNVTTGGNSHIFIIYRGDVIRNVEDFENAKVYRINNTTYLMKGVYK